MRVCIIGIGLSSLALAKALVNLNIYVDIIIEKKQNKPDQLRTIGISKSNIDFFNNRVTNIEKITWKLKNIEIYTENLKREKIINFTNNGKELFSIVKNSHLFEVLEKSLYKNIYFKKIYKKLNLDILKNYDLVINIDPSNLITKKHFNKKIVKEYNSSAHTTVIKHDKIINNTAIQVFTKRGPLAFLPLSQDETSVVYSINEKKKKRQEKIDEMIHKYNFKYKIKDIKKFVSFDLKSFNLRSYYHENILAFGDLLHRIHPLAGQGFNMTIRDIKILTNIVETKNSLGLPLDGAVCFEFENKIRHKNFIFSNGIDLVHEFFNLERKIDSNFLGKTVQFLGKNPSFNKMFTKIADKGILL